jgi:hypothetical protein
MQPSAPPSRAASWWSALGRRSEAHAPRLRTPDARLGRGPAAREGARRGPRARRNGGSLGITDAVFGSDLSTASREKGRAPDEAGPGHASVDWRAEARRPGRQGREPPPVVPARPRASAALRGAVRCPQAHRSATRARAAPDGTQSRHRAQRPGRSPAQARGGRDVRACARAPPTARPEPRLRCRSCLSARRRDAPPRAHTRPPVATSQPSGPPRPSREGAAPGRLRPSPGQPRIGEERAEWLPDPAQEPVDPGGERREPKDAGDPGHPMGGREVLEHADPCRAVHHPHPARLDELPRLAHLVHRDARDIRRGGLVLPAQKRESFLAIQLGDEPRRRTTEGSTAVE